MNTISIEETSAQITVQLAEVVDLLSKRAIPLRSRLIDAGLCLTAVSTQSIPKDLRTQCRRIIRRMTTDRDTTGRDRGNVTHDRRDDITATVKRMHECELLDLVEAIRDLEAQAYVAVARRDDD